MVPTHIACILIYLQSQNSKDYGERFVNSGGIQLTLYILEHRYIYPFHIQYKTLSIIEIIIKMNTKYKEIICINGGIQLLLNIIVDKIGPIHKDLLYLLYNILKQLSIRNESHKLFIQQSIIKYINDNSENQQAIKTMLKILQSTLIFNNDKSSDIDGTIITKNNMDHIFSLLRFGNHQITYQC